MYEKNNNNNNTYGIKWGCCPDYLMSEVRPGEERGLVILRCTTGEEQYRLREGQPRTRTNVDLVADEEVRRRRDRRGNPDAGTGQGNRDRGNSDKENVKSSHND